MFKVIIYCFAFAYILLFLDDAGFLVTTYVIPALTFLAKNLDFEIPTFRKQESDGEELYSEKVHVSDIEQCDKEFRDIKLK